MRPPRDLARVPLLLLALLLAGCAGDAALAPKLRDEMTVARVHLVGTLEREETRPGDALVTNFHLTNRGTALLYDEGGCASAPWVFEIRAEDGTLVGPLPPDPRCREAALTTRQLAANEALSHAFSWDAHRKWYDEAGAVQREPVPPGLYTLRAEVLVERDGAPIRPAVQLVLRVAS